MHELRLLPERGEALADRLARGICRRFGAMGYGTLTEFRVGKGRRVDVAGLNAEGHFLIAEIKTSVTDFRSDAKWSDYLPYCDAYFFAVPPEFPREILPPDHGLIVADAHDAEIVRDAPAQPMNGNRRRTQILRFGLAASARLNRVVDPRPTRPSSLRAV